LSSQRKPDNWNYEQVARQNAESLVKDEPTENQERRHHQPGEGVYHREQFAIGVKCLVPFLDFRSPEKQVDLLSLWYLLIYLINHRKGNKVRSKSEPAADQPRDDRVYNLTLG
jgi:hypothetical protein